MPQVIPALIAIITLSSTAAFSAGAIFAAEFILGTALSLVITGVSALLRKSPDGPSLTSDAQTRTVTSRQPVAPWRVIMGEVGQLGGVLTYMEVTGATGEFLHLIITLAGHEVNAIPNMYFDGVEVPVDGSGDATGTFAGYVHWEKGLGTAAQTAYASLVSASAGLWTSNHRQRGRANSYVRLKWSADVFPNGVPNITFKVQGYNGIYDPRTTLTGYTANSALCLRAYLTNTSWGMGATAAEINDTVAIAAANICDEAVNLKAGGTELRYTTNGTFDTSQLPKDIIPGLLSAMAGQAVYTSGAWGIYPAAWRSSSATFTDSDLRDKIQISTNRSHRDLFNGVKGVYVSPDNNWQPSDFPAFVKDATRGYVSDAYLAEDSGERIWADIQLPYTTTASRAQRLAKIHLERNRRQKTVTAPYNLSAYRVQPPDTVGVTHSRFSWSAKAFEVSDCKLSQVQDANGNPIIGCDLILAETDAGVYDWDYTTEELASTTPPVAIVPNVTTVGDPSGLTLTSGTSTVLTRTDGVKISRIKVAWTPPTDQMVISGGKEFVDIKQHSPEYAWTAQTGTTLTGGQTDPNGGTTATQVAATAAGGAFQTPSVSSTPGTPQTFSVWLRCASGTQTVQLAMNRSGSIDGETANVTIDSTWRRYEFTHSGTWTGSSAIFFFVEPTVTTQTFIAAFGQLEVYPWTQGDEVDGSIDFTFLQGVNDGIAYDVRLRSRNAAGTFGDYVYVDDHVVTGVISDISASTLLNSQASVNPTAVEPTASFGVGYDGTGPYLTITVTGGNINRSDNTTVAVPGSGPTTYRTWNGGAVAGSTLYSVNVKWQIGVGLAHDEGVGSPSIAFKAQSFRDGFVPITIGAYNTTPAVMGGGGGAGGGGSPCFSGNVPVVTIDGDTRFDAMGEFVTILNRRGEPRLAKVIVHEYSGPMLDMGGEQLSTLRHLFKREGKWVRAREIFTVTKEFSGKVYNLHIEDESDFDEQHYILGNGWEVHNMKENP